jgi:putative membrane protein
MIVRPRPTGFGLLFILRGSTMPMIAPRVLVIVVLPAGVVWLHAVAPQHLRDVTAAPFTSLGLGEELEEPFGLSQNALPLGVMVRGIEIAVETRCGMRYCRLRCCRWGLCSSRCMGMARTGGTSPS